MSAIGLLDTVLDRTTAGYTRLGYQVREATWGGGELGPMDGRVVLVTGATSGIGRAAAEGFASLGAAVRILARDAERAERVRLEIVASSGNDDVAVELCDLGDLAAVRRFAARFAARTSRLDVLVNNAGVLTAERTLSTNGIELTFATNVLAPFLLTRELAALLRRSAPARVINVSSGGMYTQRLRAADLQMASERFDGTVAYARTKRIEVILSEMWAARLAGSDVVVHAMHPGWVDTPGLESSLPRFHRLTRPLLRTPQQGADTIVWLGAASQPALTSGGFWHDRRARPTHVLPWTRESTQEREQLWAECERLAGAGARTPALRTGSAER